MPDQLPTEPDRPNPLKGIHVLHVADSDVLARFGLMLNQLMPALAATGLRVTLVTDDAELLARLDNTGVQCLHLPRMRGWRAWGLGSRLATRFAPPPSVVHVWGTANLWSLQRWLARGPIVTVIHALGAADIEHLARRGLRPHEQTVALHAALLDPLLGRFPHVAGRCRTILPAVALPFWPTREPEPGRTLGVLSVIRLDPHSGLDVLIDAAAQLRRTAFDIQVGVIGAGPNAGAAWKRIRDRNVQDCISIIDEPWLWEKVLPDADVCVVPASEQETWLTPLLAMALGKVVITSRDQTADWYVENQTCWQFTPSSAVELAYLLERVLEQPKHTHELAAAAAEYVRERHTVGSMVEQLESLYLLALGRESGSGQIVGG
jgi:glycosyltransferase involved in cell wall biosynthesis